MVLVVQQDYLRYCSWLIPPIKILVFNLDVEIRNKSLLLNMIFTWTYKTSRRNNESIPRQICLTKRKVDSKK
ncbi:hypothetical protein RJT34_28250 [Clitoria ternatea]|uniref:Uncharacterized protein n=1 Tax=Clitoria ternatea TaxID=43366 RepID=A0AAN9F8N9_CLITE